MHAFTCRAILAAGAVACVGFYLATRTGTRKKRLRHQNGKQAAGQFLSPVDVHDAQVDERCTTTASFRVSSEPLLEPSSPRSPISSRNGVAQLRQHFELPASTQKTTPEPSRRESDREILLAREMQKKREHGAAAITEGSVAAGQSKRQERRETDIDNIVKSQAEEIEEARVLVTKQARVKATRNAPMSVALLPDFTRLPCSETQTEDEQLATIKKTPTPNTAMSQSVPLCEEYVSSIRTGGQDVFECPLAVADIEDVLVPKYARVKATRNSPKIIAPPPYSEIGIEEETLQKTPSAQQEHATGL